MWTLFQAKTVRQTVVRTAAEGLDAQYKDAADAPAAVKAQIEQWRKTARRYDTEPETNEGRKELMARAKVYEARCEEARAAYHLFEYGSAAFQLAIVLAGASALTAVAWLAFVSGGLGLIGAAFTLPGLLRANSGPPLDHASIDRNPVVAGRTTRRGASFQLFRSAGVLARS